MSMLQTVKIKLGGAVDKFKNFIFDASRLDGVFDLKRESGETIFSIDANNNLNIPGYIFPGMMQVGNNDSDDNNFVFDATADNGTMKLARESGQDIMTVAANGKPSFPQLAKSLGANANIASSFELPNGLIIKTGVTGSVGAGGGLQVNFNTPFPNVCLSVCITSIIGSGSTGVLSLCLDPALPLVGSFAARNPWTAGALSGRYIAIGY